eukprot:gene4022-4658_t
MSHSTINFYRQGDAYGCFSNFSAHAVFWKGQSFQTSEHVFQAMKFEGTPHYEEVRRCSTAGNSAKMGRSRALPLRKDWEQIKDQLMFDKYTSTEMNDFLRTKFAFLERGDVVSWSNTLHDDLVVRPPWDSNRGKEGCLKALHSFSAKYIESSVSLVDFLHDHTVPNAAFYVMDKHILIK